MGKTRWEKLHKVVVTETTKICTPRAQQMTRDDRCSGRSNSEANSVVRHIPSTRLSSTLSRGILSVLTNSKRELLPRWNFLNDPPTNLFLLAIERLKEVKRTNLRNGLLHLPRHPPVPTVRRTNLNCIRTPSPNYVARYSPVQIPSLANNLFQKYP